MSGMKEGTRVYGRKHERKFYGRLGRKRWRGNLLRKRQKEEDVGVFKYEQGDVLRDKITRFVGTVTARTDFFNGCVQYLLEGESIDGKKPDAAWVDEQQVEKLRENENLAAPEPEVRRGGGQRPHPVR